MPGKTNSPLEYGGVLVCSPQLFEICAAPRLAAVLSAVNKSVSWSLVPSTNSILQFGQSECTASISREVSICQPEQSLTLGLQFPKDELPPFWLVWRKQPLAVV